MNYFDNDSYFQKTVIHDSVYYLYLSFEINNILADNFILELKKILNNKIMMIKSKEALCPGEYKVKGKAQWKAENKNEIKARNIKSLFSLKESLPPLNFSYFDKKYYENFELVQKEIFDETLLVFIDSLLSANLYGAKTLTISFSLSLDFSLNDNFNTFLSSYLEKPFKINFTLPLAPSCSLADYLYQLAEVSVPKLLHDDLLSSELLEKNKEYLLEFYFFLQAKSKENKETFYRLEEPFNPEELKGSFSKIIKTSSSEPMTSSDALKFIILRSSRLLDQSIIKDKFLHPGDYSFSHLFRITKIDERK